MREIFTGLPWWVKWVAVPELGASIATLEPTIAKLEAWGVSYLIDPILEPIGMGFMASLERYAEARRRWPGAEMLMGIGNLTEMTAADSTGINALLIAICQELGIRYEETGLLASYGVALRHLHEVGRPLRGARQG